MENKQDAPDQSGIIIRFQFIEIKREKNLTMVKQTREIKAKIVMRSDLFRNTHNVNIYKGRGGPYITLPNDALILLESIPLSFTDILSMGNH